MCLPGFGNLPPAPWLAQLRGAASQPAPLAPPLPHPSRAAPHPPQVYAIYGAFFILLSYLWGWAVDGVRPDTGDWVGSGIAIGGGLVAFFWPR